MSELEEIARRSPTALTFEIGKEGFYAHGAIQDYVERIDTLRYIVFTDTDGRFSGFANVTEFSRLLDNYDLDIVDEIEDGTVLEREMVRTASIPSDSTNEACLRTMDAHNVDELAVVDESDEFVGVVTQDAIVRKLVSAAFTQA